jgi:hypothetical protein
VEDPSTGEKVEKTVYVVFFAGERARAKILKICEAGMPLCTDSPGHWHTRDVSLWSFDQNKCLREVASALYNAGLCLDDMAGIIW